MSDLDAIVEAYTSDLFSADPILAAVARHQLEQLRATAASPAVADRASPPSRWAHVPLAALFEQAGNRVVRRRSTGDLECGHEPWHRSRSGACVLISPASGRWWCRSCKRRGDAASFLMDLHGCSYAVAAATLESRFGPAADRRRPGRGRPTFREG